MKKKVLLSSIAMIALCLALIAGSTFALFTQQTKVNIVVSAGDLDVAANIQEETVKVRSLGVADFHKTYGNQFPNGGHAELDASTGKLQIYQMTPGDAVSFEIEVENTGDVAVAYSVDWASNFDQSNYNGKKDMFSQLKFTVTTGGKTFVDGEGEDVYYALGAPGAKTTFLVTVEFVNKNDGSNDNYQGAVADINFIVKTVQANGIDANGNIITD